MKKLSGRPVRILLVEDNPADVLLLREAFREGDIQKELVVAVDGVEATAMLRKQGEYHASPRPDLILLDLNLPRKDGREVLADIKSDAMLKCIPVVVLSTSEDEHDICMSYELHANCYITKPVSLDSFFDVVRSIDRFWLGVTELPGA